MLRVTVLKLDGLQRLMEPLGRTGTRVSLKCHLLLVSMCGIISLEELVSDSRLAVRLN